MKRYLVEAVGTFFLTMAVSLSLMANPIAIGLMLMAMIYMGGYISGGHFNPAVTTAVWLCNGFSLTVSMGYKVAQVLGALAAGALFYGMTETLFVMPAEGPLAWGVVHEALLGFVFCAVALTVMERYKVAGVGGLVIGLTLVAIAFLGGVVNPALGICSMVSCLLKGEFVSALDNVLVHVAGPMLGAIVAAYWYKYLNTPEIHGAHTQQRVS